MKNFNQLAKNELLKIFLSSIKTKVIIKFPKQTKPPPPPPPPPLPPPLKIGLGLKGLSMLVNEIFHDCITVKYRTLCLVRHIGWVHKVTLLIRSEDKKFVSS